jgi:hypothetical protein
LRYSLPRFLQPLHPPHPHSHSDASKRDPEHRGAIVETPCQRGGGLWGGRGSIRGGKGGAVNRFPSIQQFWSEMASRGPEPLPPEQDLHSHAPTHTKTRAYTGTCTCGPQPLPSDQKEKKKPPSSWNRVLQILNIHFIKSLTLARELREHAEDPRCSRHVCVCDLCVYVCECVCLYLYIYLSIGVCIYTYAHMMYVMDIDR